MISPGKYQHYKGGMYEVIGTALHSETLEWMVVYKPLYYTPDILEGTLWVRPLIMFSEIIEIDGMRVERFKKIEN